MSSVTLRALALLHLRVEHVVDPLPALGLDAEPLALGLFEGAQLGLDVDVELRGLRRSPFTIGRPRLAGLESCSIVMSRSLTLMSSARTTRAVGALLLELHEALRRLGRRGGRRRVGAAASRRALGDLLLERGIARCCRAASCSCLSSRARAASCRCSASSSAFFFGRVLERLLVELQLWA